MTWLRLLLPFVSRALHALEVQRRDELIVELTRQRDYWQTRAELMIDQALARRGEIDGPTMRESKLPPAHTLVDIASRMMQTEIDSSKTRKTG